MSLWQKIMHKLFGWDYDLVLYGYDYNAFRVITTANGEKFAACYGSYEPLKNRKHSPLTY